LTDTLVDSSVLIDLLSDDPHWRPWSSAALIQARSTGLVLINPIIRAEIVARLEESRVQLPPLDLWLKPRDLPWAAADLAGRAHAGYRRRGGARTAILADFLIGAHALVEGLTLLTRDPNRVRTAFPDLDIVAPEP